MTHIQSFSASHSQASLYHKTHRDMLALGDSIDGTPDDLRPSVENSAKFQVDRITVYANTDKQQVVLTEKLRGDEIDGSYIAEGAGEAVSAQTYRSVLKPNEFGTLEVTEEVNNRDSQGRLVSSWARKVAADEQTGAFLIYDIEKGTP